MLTVDITSVKDWENYCLQEISESELLEGRNFMRLYPDDKHRYNPVTEVLIFAALPCGFNEITEKNWRQVARRIDLYERTFGTFLTSPNGRPVFIDEDHVKRHIGMRTNASTLTEAQFKKKMGENAIREMQSLQRAKQQDAKVEAKARPKRPGERDDVDYEETYYKAERELRAAGYDVTKLDEALDEDDESANEYLERVHDGEDAVQLASEYEFIE